MRAILILTSLGLACAGISACASRHDNSVTVAIEDDPAEEKRYRDSLAQAEAEQRRLDDLYWEDLRRRNPTWTEEQVSDLKAGMIWKGMTEEQFLIVMKRTRPRADWSISVQPRSKMYFEKGSSDVFYFGSETTLYYWSMHTDK
ncbi:MAG: hypothetical protein FD180_3192 [Planctomycetota bacterium]|nr:MAG: hypothetical protein FD180_3192 [Planctomycetota bacterium]